jgi:hypothetical protein
MILTVLGEAACRGIEVAAIERLAELFRDEPTGLDSVQAALLWRHGIEPILHCVRLFQTRSTLGWGNASTVDLDHQDL